MIIETSIVISAAWLLDRVTDKAIEIDKRSAIKDSLETSIKSAYLAFIERNRNLANIIFDNEFLTSHLCPEIEKLLTRNVTPDIEKVVKNLPPQAIVISGANLFEEVQWLIDTIWEELKKHANLQFLIDHRQIEEGSSRLDNISSKQDLLLRDLQSGLDRISQDSAQQHQDSRDILDTFNRKLNPLLGLLNQAIPSDSTNGRLDTFLNKQLDRVKTYLNEDKLSEAYELLMSLQEEVNTSESYTQFRWHTNLGAFHLAMGAHSKAVAEFFSAHSFAPDDEKANANKLRAFLLQGDNQSGLGLSQTLLDKFPKSELIWALHLNANKLCNIPTDTIQLPDEIKYSTSVLHIQSEIQIDQGAYAEAYNLAFQALETMPESHELKRALLRAALTWATVDNVKAHFSQLSTDVLTALDFTLKCFGDPIEYLKAIQSPEHFVEAATNLAIASEIIGDREAKSFIVSYAYDRAPKRAELLFHKVMELRSKKDIVSLKQLSQDKLESLDTEVLFILYECSANNGDLEWSQELHSELNNRTLTRTQKSEHLGIEISALWNSGEQEKAIEHIKNNSSEIDHYPALKALHIRILDELGDNGHRDQLLDTLEYSEEWASYEILQVADILYDFKRYYRAAEFYEILVELPTYNDLTKRYTSSLIRSEQRSKAQSVLRKLPDELANTSDFRKLTANLAQICGDLQTLTETLYKELEECPKDSSIAVWYVAAMFRKNELDTLKKYISTAPSYSPLIAENEFEIAKYEIELGLEENALKRIYRAFQSSPNDPKIAGFYLCTILLLKSNELLNEPDKAIPGSSVSFESNNAHHSVLIQPKELQLAGVRAWAECIDEDSNIAKKIIGLNIDDTIDLGPGKHNAKVRQLKSIYTFASEKAHEVISKSVSNYGPLWSINIMDPEGKLDPSEMIESLKSRKAHVESVFNAYKSHKLPLDILAKALGTDLLTLILEWPHKECDLFVSSGRTDEREEIKTFLTSTDKRFVLDFSSLVELQRLGILHDCTHIIGKPLVSLSLIDAIKNIQRLNGNLSPTAHAYEKDGQLILDDIPDAFIQERKKLIEDLLKFLNKECEISAVVGPETPSSSLTELGDIVSNLAQDAFYLSLEHDAILICEDGALRAIAKDMGVRVTSWLQPLMMLLRDNGKITQSRYSEAALDKLLKRHSFTSIDARDLLWSAEKDLTRVEPQTAQAIFTFESGHIDLESVISVGATFLFQVAGKVSSETLKSYFLTLESVLKKGRENYAHLIREKLRESIIVTMQAITANSSREIIHTFGDLLLPLPFNPRPKLLAVSISDALYR